MIRRGVFTKCGGIFKIFDVLKLSELKNDFFPYVEYFYRGMLIDEIREKFNEYLNSEMAIETCNYCHGLSESMVRIVTTGQQN